jgi:CheY-like chemotaxis protein
MPPPLHLQPTPPLALYQRELDRVIATLLRHGSVSGTATHHQHRPPDADASLGPAADRASGYDPAVQQPTPAAEPTPPRVLIADDAPAMRAALRGLLEDHGLPIIGEAADGLQAVTMASQLQPDVVVMDVRMPGLDGLQATTRITGAHQAGAAAFVPKHAPPDHVPAAVLATWQAASTTPTPPGALPRDHPQ